MNKLKDVKHIGKKMKKKEADHWVKRYQKKHKDGTHGWLYGSDILEKLIHEDGADGIWFFKGINEKGEERLVMYPADKDGNILKKEVKSLGAMAGKGGGDDDSAADDAEPCPPNCPPEL